MRPNELAFSTSPDVDPRQIDLITWKPVARPLLPPGTQLSFFGLDVEPPKP